MKKSADYAGSGLDAAGKDTGVGTLPLLILAPVSLLAVLIAAYLCFERHDAGQRSYRMP